MNAYYLKIQKMQKQDSPHPTSHNKFWIFHIYRNIPYIYIYMGKYIYIPDPFSLSIFINFFFFGGSRV
jgi:hypothetical protein